MHTLELLKYLGFSIDAASNIKLCVFQFESDYGCSILTVSLADLEIQYLGAKSCKFPNRKLKMSFDESAAYKQFNFLTHFIIAVLNFRPKTIEVCILIHNLCFRQMFPISIFFFLFLQITRLKTSGENENGDVCCCVRSF